MSWMETCFDNSPVVGYNAPQIEEIVFRPMTYWFGLARNRIRCVLAWAIVGLMLCSACSSPAGVIPVVKIGLVAPFEGPQRAMAYDALFASKLAVGQFNELQRTAGGPLVELVALNDDGQPARSKQVAREMVVDPAIVGVIGPWDPASAETVAATYGEGGLAVVYPGPGFPQVDAPGEFVLLRLSATNAQIGARAAEYAAQVVAAPRVVVVRDENPVSDVQADAFVAALEELGVPLAASLSPATDPVAFALNVEALEPDVLFLSGESEEIIRAVTALDEAGVDAVCVVGPELDRFDLVQIARHAAAKLTVVALGPSWHELGQHKEFVDAFRTIAGKPPSTQAVLAFDAANVLLKAVAGVAETANVTRSSVSAYLQGAESFSGITGAWTFDGNGNRLDPPLWVRGLEF